MNAEASLLMKLTIEAIVLVGIHSCSLMVESLNAMGKKAAVDAVAVV